MGINSSEQPAASGTPRQERHATRLLLNPENTHPHGNEI